MKKNYLFSMSVALLATLLSASFISCGGDSASESEPTPPPSPEPVSVTTLSVSGLDAPFAADAQSMSQAQDLIITTNATWGITDKPDWLDITPQNGTGNATVKVWPNSANTTASARTATITIQAGDKTVTKSVTQRTDVDGDLYVAPKTIIVLADGYAFDFTFGSKVMYYYVKRYLPSELSRKTDAEIIEEMSADASLRDTPSDNYVTSWQYQTPSTQYVICTVGYDSNGKHGVLTKTYITTKSDANQALAIISDVYYSSTDNNWHWSTTVNGYVSKYYMWKLSNNNLYAATDAAVAWFFSDAIKTYPDNFAPIAQGSTWYAARNSGENFHVVTWALNVEGNFSGEIYRFRSSGAASARQLEPAGIPAADSRQSHKTMKEDFSILK